MADDVYQGNTRSSTKGRSASICAPGSSSMETLMAGAIICTNGNGSGTATPTHGQTGTPESGTPGAGRRRKPATRSQSARISGGRSIRRKVVASSQMSSNNNQENKTLYNSEPRLAEQGQEASPAIRRKGSSRRGTSVYQHRKSAAFLDVPETRHFTRSGDDVDPDDEDAYRIRSFSSTSKGIINRGDSFRRRRSRSSSLCPGHHALPDSIRDTPPRSPGGKSHCDELIADGHLNKAEPYTGETRNYKVALIGAPGVGKTALISQFMTSECINAYDRQKDMSGEQTVSIMLNGEESELTFLNVANLKDIDKSNLPDAFVVLYSVVDRSSMNRAESDLRILHDTGLLRGRPALVAANKIDLARSRAVTAQDGKCLACTYRAKFIEISVGINHNVDELLVGILNQIRLKEAQGLQELSSTSQWYKNRGVVRASMKARQMFTWIFGREDTKFKNCENLHIL